MRASFHLLRFFYFLSPFQYYHHFGDLHQRLNANICCFEVGSVGSLWVELAWWKTAWSSGKQMSPLHFNYRIYVSHLFIRRCHKSLIAYRQKTDELNSYSSCHLGFGSRGSRYNSTSNKPQCWNGVVKVAGDRSNVWLNQIMKSRKNLKCISCFQVDMTVKIICLCLGETVGLSFPCFKAGLWVGLHLRDCVTGSPK